MMIRHGTAHRTAAFILTAITSATFAAPATAHAAAGPIAVAGGKPKHPLVTLTTFTDPDEHPESVAIGRDGTVHVGLHAAARIWHRMPDGRTIVTRLPRAAKPEIPTRANGVAVSPDGTVAVAVLSGDATIAGVWQGRPGRKFIRIATLPVTAGPNGMSRDRAGNLYIADDALGVIWRVPANRPTKARPAKVWLRHHLLNRAPGGTPYGANGTELHNGRLWVSNPSQQLVAAIPIDPDGEPGQPAVMQRGSLFADVDDFDVTPGGALVVARISAQTVEQVRPDGTTTVLATTTAGLSQPTAVAIDAHRRTAYITNAAFYRPPGAPPASVQALPLPRR
jgi:DNA-binding beta-propeller fold protein YncE